MFNTENLPEPKFGNKESGHAFVLAALKEYERAYSEYSGKADKATAKVGKVVEAIKENDPDAVKLADQVMAEIRSLILNAVEENVNVSALMFGELDEAKKAVGSWRDEVTINVENEESDEDRDLVAEYEALDNARTMIEGTFMAWNLDASHLPEKFKEEKRENTGTKDAKGKPVWKNTGTFYLKFPGKLTNPNSESKVGGPGKVATSAMFSWELVDHEENVWTMPKGVTITSLARICSTQDSFLSFADLKERLDNRDWSKQNTVTVTVPRGKLIGTKTTK